MSKDRSRENSASNHSASDREGQGVTRDTDATATRIDQASGMEDKVVLTDMASRLKSLEHKLATQPAHQSNPRGHQSRRISCRPGSGRRQNAGF